MSSMAGSCELEMFDGSSDRINIPMFQKFEFTELYVNGMNSYEALPTTDRRRFYFLIGVAYLHFQNDIPS